MGLTRHCYLAALMILLGSAAAQADSHRLCKSIASDADRLACYDADAASSANNPDPAAKLCEQVLLASIKTPATYHSVNQTVSGDHVELSFDAENGFGALVRETFSCRFVHNPSGYRLVGPEYAKVIFDNMRIPQASTALSSPIVPDFQKAPAAPSSEDYVSDCLQRGKHGHVGVTLNEADGSHTVIVRDQPGGPALFSCHFPTLGPVTIKPF